MKLPFRVLLLVASVLVHSINGSSVIPSPESNDKQQQQQLPNPPQSGPQSSQQLQQHINGKRRQGGPMAPVSFSGDGALVDYTYCLHEQVTYIGLWSVHLNM